MLLIPFAIAAPPTCEGLLRAPAAEVSVNPATLDARVQCAATGAEALFEAWIDGAGRDETLRRATLEADAAAAELRLRALDVEAVERTRARRLGEVAEGRRPFDGIEMADLEARADEARRQLQLAEIRRAEATGALATIVGGAPTREEAARLYALIVPLLRDRAELPVHVTAAHWERLYVTAAILQRLMGGDPGPHLDDLARMYGTGGEEVLRYDRAPGWARRWHDAVLGIEGEAKIVLEGDFAEYTLDGRPILGLDAEPRKVWAGFHRVERVDDDGTVHIWAGELDAGGLLGLRWTGEALVVWDPTAPPPRVEPPVVEEPPTPAPARMSVGGGWSYVHDHHFALGGVDFAVPTPGLAPLEWHLGTDLLLSPKPVYIRRWQDESVLPRLRAGASWRVDWRSLVFGFGAGGQLTLGIGGGPWVGIDAILPIERMPVRASVVVPFTLVDKLGYAGVELRLSADLPLGGVE